MTKAFIKGGVAVTNSVVDNHGKSIGTIAKGAVVNLAINKVAGNVSKLTKGVGSNRLNKVANKVLGSKSKIVKNIVANNNISHKTASTIARVVNSGEKAVAKQVVREANQNVTKTVTAGAADAAQKKILESNN